MAVTLQTGFLEPSVVFVGQFQTAVRKVMSAKSHQLVCKSTKVRTSMTGGAVILLEELISFQLLCCEGGIISTQPFVKCGVRSDESALELLYGIRYIGLSQSVRVYLLKCTSKLPVSFQLRNDLIKRL